MNYDEDCEQALTDQEAEHETEIGKRNHDKVGTDAN